MWTRVDRKSYASVKEAFVRFINTCGKPSLVISDSDSAFKAMSRDYKLSELQWINRFDRSRELQELKKEFNIKFQFNTANSPQLQRTLMATNQAMLNKRSLGVLHENNPEMWRIVSPHHLLTGYALDVSPNFVDNKIQVPRSIGPIQKLGSKS